MMKRKFLPLIAVLAFPLLVTGPAAAHAYPEQDTPGAGAVLEQGPTKVSIRFDSELEPVFSTLIVKDARNRQVSQGNGSVDPSNGRILSTTLTNAAKGSYHVYWSVVSRDGHRAKGDYTFTVR